MAVLKYRNSATGEFQEIPISAAGALAPSDHGELTGLADDDHPQYHTDARSDARNDGRYLKLAGGTVGPLTIGGTTINSGSIGIDDGSWAGLDITATEVPYIGMSGPNAMVYFTTMDAAIYDDGAGNLCAVVGSTGALTPFYAGPPDAGTAVTDVNYVNYYDAILAYAIYLKPNVTVSASAPAAAKVGDLWVVP